jgi:protein TonB
VAANVAQSAKEFDEHLSMNVINQLDGKIRLAITTQPGVAPPPPLPPFNAPPGASKIGGNVMAANLINPVKPVYPPLAKMARQQGTVKFQALIGKDGTIEELQVVSGPPLLIQAASDAVSKWVYRPTVLNGNTVEVVTTIDVNFSLSGGDGPAPFPPQQ